MSGVPIDADSPTIVNSRLVTCVDRTANVVSVYFASGPLSMKQIKCASEAVAETIMQSFATAFDRDAR